nr:hypothetical protein [Clostridium paraputrificum]
MKIFKRNKKRQRLILKANINFTKDAVDRLKKDLSDSGVDVILIPKGFDIVGFDRGVSCNEAKKL